MNSGYSTISSTYLNDQLTEFTDYVWSFYGADDAVYPMGLKKVDLLSAIYDYLHEIGKRNDEHFTWGDGDSLDRERVRDILVIKYGYDEEFYGGSVLREDFTNEF